MLRILFAPLEVTDELENDTRVYQYLSSDKEMLGFFLSVFESEFTF